MHEKATIYGLILHENTSWLENKDENANEIVNETVNEVDNEVVNEDVFEVVK